MIKIILSYLAVIITLICYVHDAKIYDNSPRRNTKRYVLFIKKNFKHKQKYHLNAKKFINFKEIQLQRIKEYRERSGPDKNNINYNIKDAYNYHEDLLFVRNEVFPTLAKIENEKLKKREKYRELFRNINDYNTNFSRQSFMQFLIDIYNIFLKIDEIFLIYKEDFSLLTYAGPMLLTNHLYDDLIYLTSVVQNCEDITVSQYGREYISHLEELSQKNKLKFLAHAYIFYKSFHLNKEHLLNSICKYLNIIKKLKSSKYVPDVSNFEFCLNKMSRKWNRWDKDNFLASLHDATDKMMILTKHFQQIKE
ncbi:heme oxygenase [Plasmodium gonderi]|uniref:Heme oxygenase n=1 Tax=Plasmodium gonderi TaxID=77519 RepID=A0A1Y1JIA8_PLAGO|nr:heme oxygenase [Plasmodium gonderi]GAW80542.1 heme oxygenase [Plasmodium gonderi]